MISLATTTSGWDIVWERGFPIHRVLKARKGIQLALTAPFLVALFQRLGREERDAALVTSFAADSGCRGINETDVGTFR